MSCAEAGVQGSGGRLAVERSWGRGWDGREGGASENHPSPFPALGLLHPRLQLRSPCWSRSWSWDCLALEGEDKLQPSNGAGWVLAGPLRARWLGSGTSTPQFLTCAMGWSASLLRELEEARWGRGWHYPPPPPPLPSLPHSQPCVGNRHSVQHGPHRGRRLQSSNTFIPIRDAYWARPFTKKMVRKKKGGPGCRGLRL